MSLARNKRRPNEREKNIDSEKCISCWRVRQSRKKMWSVRADADGVHVLAIANIEKEN